MPQPDYLTALASAVRRLAIDERSPTMPTTAPTVRADVQPLLNAAVGRLEPARIDALAHGLVHGHDPLGLFELFDNRQLAALERLAARQYGPLDD